MADKSTKNSNTVFVSDELIAKLEKDTGLLDSKEGILYIMNMKSLYQTKREHYVARLLILVDGVDSVGTIVSENNPITGRKKNIRISVPMFKQMNRKAQDPNSKILKTTPAGVNGAFEPIGSQGVVGFLNTLRLDLDPFTGSFKNTPTLSTNLLNSIHPKFVETVEKYCKFIKARAYLALPAKAYGSLNNLVSKLNNVLSSFQTVIYSVYKGVTRAIQQFYSYINGIMVKIQNMMISIIEQIIPLDLICLIFETMQTILDDINFFSSLFGQSGSVFTYLNDIQQFLNQASTFASNPFTTIDAYIPPEVKNITDSFSQLGADPSGFLTDQLSNYGYAWAVNALQGDIMGAVINKYGAQYAAIGPVSELLNGSENYSRNLSDYPKTPAIIGPNVYTVDGKNYNEHIINDPRVLVGKVGSI